jgi:hypothetical protein
MNTPSLIFLRIRRLQLLQQLLERIIIAVKPSPQLSELTLGRLLNRFHLTYLLLIKKLHLLPADAKVDESNLVL